MYLGVNYFTLEHKTVTKQYKRIVEKLSNYNGFGFQLEWTDKKGK